MKSILLVLIGFAGAAWLLPWDGKPDLAAAWRKASDHRTYESLNDEQQRAVRREYQALLAAYERKDFSQLQENAEKILARVTDFGDTKSYLEIAKRKLTELSH